MTKPRARDIGIPFDGTSGPNNAITDIPGVEVGMTTLIEGEGPLEVGKGPIRCCCLDLVAIYSSRSIAKLPIFW